MKRSKDNLHREQDIAIVGAGMGGLVAALEAATAGARVTVLDKLPPMIGKEIKAIVPGGPGNETSRAGGGGLGRFSLEAPIEELLERHRVRGWGRADLSLLRTYLERLGADCRWLRDGLGIPFLEKRQVFASTMIRGRGPALMRYLYQAAEGKNVDVRFKTKALNLLTDDMGRVTGVRIKNGGGVADLQAKAVILATGGFEGNHEMLLKYVGPEITYGTILTGCPTNTGDGS